MANLAKMPRKDGKQRPTPDAARKEDWQTQREMDMVPPKQSPLPQSRKPLEKAQETGSGRNKFSPIGERSEEPTEADRAIIIRYNNIIMAHWIDKSKKAEKHGATHVDHLETALGKRTELTNEGTNITRVLRNRSLYIASDGSNKSETNKTTYGWVCNNGKGSKEWGGYAAYRGEIAGMIAAIAAVQKSPHTTKLRTGLSP